MKELMEWAGNNPYLFTWCVMCLSAGVSCVKLCYVRTTYIQKDNTQNASKEKNTP